MQNFKLQIRSTFKKILRISILQWFQLFDFCMVPVPEILTFFRVCDISISRIDTTMYISVELAFLQYFT